MIGAIAESWVTILVAFTFACGLMLGSALTYRLCQYDRAERERLERERGR